MVTVLGIGHSACSMRRDALFRPDSPITVAADCSILIPYFRYGDSDPFEGNKSIIAKDPFDTANNPGPPDIIDWDTVSLVPSSWYHPGPWYHQSTCRTTPICSGRLARTTEQRPSRDT